MIDWYYKLPLSEIYAACKRHGLDPLLVSALIWKESSGNTFAMRYEFQLSDTYPAKMNYRDWADNLGITHQTELVAQKTSWGLMQVMGFVARELGFSDHLPELCTPRVGLEYGCMKLKQLFTRYGDAEQAIAAYNLGSPRRTAGGLFLNQKNYVDPIFRRFRELEKARDEKTLGS